MYKPYEENEDKRTFYPETLDFELEWHVDFEDRIIKIISSNNWLLQFDNQIPKKLQDGQEIFIKKMTWHRIIKGDGILVVEIKKLS